MRWPAASHRRKLRDVESNFDSKRARERCQIPPCAARPRSALAPFTRRCVAGVKPSEAGANPDPPNIKRGASFQAPLNNFLIHLVYALYNTLGVSLRRGQLLPLLVMATFSESATLHLGKGRIGNKQRGRRRLANIRQLVGGCPETRIGVRIF